MKGSNSFCLQQCIDAKAVSYRNNEGGSCVCYNADCCTMPSNRQRDNPPCGTMGTYTNYVVSSIGINYRYFVLIKTFEQSHLFSVVQLL